MPTISSFGTGKPVEFFSISDSTPGAILQPQPPPWENDVSLIASLLMLISLISLMLKQIIHQLQQCRLLGRWSEERSAGVALRAQARVKVLVLHRAVDQARQRGGVAGREIAGVVVAQHAAI